MNRSANRVNVRPLPIRRSRFRCALEKAKDTNLGLEHVSVLFDVGFHAFVMSSLSIVGMFSLANGRNE